jgi:SAM-dependent methyltransferase
MVTRETDPGRRMLDRLRLAVPWDAAVVTLGAEAEGIGRRVVVPLLDDGGAGADLSDEALIARLEKLRAEGCEYLVVAASAYGLLAQAPGLERHLESRYRLMERADDCAVYALHGVDRRTGADGLPLPPVDLVRITSGLYRRATDPDAIARRYEATGAQGAAWIRSMLARNGIDIDALGDLLDFGCGCGRVTRHWKDLPGHVHGTDYNPHLVGWCAEHLTFADFALNSFDPPLPFGDACFDLVYSISIFTHLDEPLQVPWMRELTRVVRPGGWLLITLSGEERLRSLPAWNRLREPFEAGGLVVTKAERWGTNACAVYHPRPYVDETLTAGLELLEYASGGADDVRQDAVLLRKPEA